MAAPKIQQEMTVLIPNSIKYPRHLRGRHVKGKVVKINRKSIEVLYRNKFGSVAVLVKTGDDGAPLVNADDYKNTWNKC